MPEIKNICLSSVKGPKTPVLKANIITNYGIETDFHAKEDSLKQISILLQEDIDKFKKTTTISINPGDFGENLIIGELTDVDIKPGDMICINDVVLEITIIGKECISPCIISKNTGYCIMPEKGIFSKVINGGNIKVEDRCTYNK
jgi:MOSC domain-containing protein YiiM